MVDSLYCQEPMFKAIAQLKQKFICCFKRGSIPTLYDEALELRKMQPENRIVRETKKDGKPVKQVITWVEGLDYQGMRLDFVMCEETVDGQTTTVAFLTKRSKIEVAGFPPFPFHTADRCRGVLALDFALLYALVSGARVGGLAEPKFAGAVRTNEAMRRVRFRGAYRSSGVGRGT